MTMQLQEVLLYRGRRYALRNLPLRACTDPALQDRLARLAKGAGVEVRCSSLWRGYRGTWEVKAGRLWLVDLESARTVVSVRRDEDAPPIDPTGFDALGLSWLFPGAVGPVAADWFTGVLASPRGRARRTGQFAYGTPYRRVFSVVAGAIVGTELQDTRAELRAGIRKFENFCRILA